MAGSILVVCYDSSTGKYLAQLAGSSQIGDGAITSAKIASGAVGGPHIYPGAVTSAKIASGAVFGDHIYPGAVTAPKIGTDAVTSGKIAAGAVGTTDRLADAIVTSAKVGLGAIGHTLLYDAGVVSGKLAAGAVGTTDRLADGIVVSSKIGAGEVGDTLVKDWGIISGKLASGVVTDDILASGVSIDIAEILQEPSYRAKDTISAYLAVQFNLSGGYFYYAQAADPDTMPGIGLAITNLASGDLGTIQMRGRIQNTAWDFSGYIGELLFVGTSSEVTVMVSGLMISGRCQQRLGKVISPDIAYLSPDLTFVQIAE